MANSVFIFGLLGTAIGTVAVLGGIAAIIYATGQFEYLGGKKKSKIPAVGKEELKEKILDLNYPDLPYQIQASKETDLILDWKIVDAKWYGIFSKERLKKTYRGFILLDEERKTARYCEEMGEVSWHIGTDGLWQPSVKFRAEFLKGRILFQKSWGVQYGIKKDLTFGKVYEYKFDIKQVRDPLKKVIEENGWEFVPVIRKSHAAF